MTLVLTNEVEANAEEVSVLDSSLTSLSWLQNLRVHDLISPPSLVTDIFPSPEKCLPSSPQGREGNRCGRNSYGISLSPIKKCLLQSADFKRHPRKYSNSSEKPPFSYSTLLYLAIIQSKTGKVTLNEIYRWVKDNFQYYKYAEASWQNSIRHNLSLNELFCKVPRTHGKGNHWRINPNYNDLLEDNKEYFYLDNRRSKLRSSKLKGNCGRKRTHSQSESNLQGRSMRGIKRRRTEGTSPADLSGMPGDLDWMSLLGSQRMSNTAHYRPVFGSPDLPHVTEPALSSPLVFPVTATAIPTEKLPATPLVVDSHSSLLEEVVLKQDSPSPQVVLPWAEKNSQSPSSSAHLHPWAESKESTMHGLKNLCRRTKSLGGVPPTTYMHPIWSPDQSWSSSSSSGFSVAALQLRTPLLSGTN